jgi:hypothetical protein
VTFILSCFSAKRRAHKPAFTTTKAVKRGVGTSARATPCPSCGSTSPRRPSNGASRQPGAPGLLLGRLASCLLWVDLLVFYLVFELVIHEL